MARIRTVKPELFRHEELFELEVETGLPIRLSFIGLFTCADREGRFVWKPRQLKLDCLPYDDIDFSRVLDALVTRGFVVRYASQGKEFGCIPSFLRHQVINNREKPSEIPSFNESDGEIKVEEKNNEKTDSSTRDARVKDASTTPLEKDQGEGKGREGEKEGKGNNSSSRKLKFADNDMELAEYFLAWMRKNQPDFKQPSLDAWANSFRLIREIDKRPRDDLVAVIDWAAQDSFWKSNVMCPDKLRKQYDQLKLKMQENQNGTGQSRQGYFERQDDLHDAVTNYNRATSF